MLSAKKMASALEDFGLKIVSYEETKDPELMDGEVKLENSLSVQVGHNYACLCIVKEEGIDYLLEKEGLATEDVFAMDVANFLKSWPA